jgi:predicted transcriptional regulator
MHMTAPKKKAQISVYLDPDVMKALSAYAARREQSLSLIAEAAIASFLSPDADERREAAIAKRLDQQDRRLARLERDVAICVETLALFIRFWLNTTPPLPEPAAKAARAQAGARYDHFIATLGRRLNEGPKFRQEILEDVTAKSDAPDAGS